MMDHPTSPNVPNESRSLGVGKAILLGHLVGTVPALAILLFFLSIGSMLAILAWISSDAIRPLWLYMVITLLAWGAGIFLGRLWWLFAIPRWYVWAVRNGVPADLLEARAVAAGLMWRNGLSFKKTEFKPKD